MKSPEKQSWLVSPVASLVTSLVPTVALNWLKFLQVVEVTGVVISVTLHVLSHPPSPFPSAPHPVPSPIHVLSTMLRSLPANALAKLPSIFTSAFPLLVSVIGASVED